jgi:phenylalanine-4-hydroxylase
VSERVRRARTHGARSQHSGEEQHTHDAYRVLQQHDEYTSMEHDTWRLLLARTEALVNRHEARLHPAYVEGFRRLVLPWKSIPQIEDVNAALAPHGWSTLCVNGYIPPEVYSGLLARSVFPIARDIRPREHLEFSPTPDLAHDMLGHIPMLASAEHCHFLRRIARATASAAPTPLDRELFEAHRALGALRSAAPRRRRSLLAAEARVEAAQAALAAVPSPLAQLDRLYLWSIEFGLMGTPDDYLVYGAGLLSSPGEAEALFTGGPPLFDFSTAVTRRGIHFSEYQSAYFVARDHAQLEQVLSRVEAAWVR